MLNFSQLYLSIFCLFISLLSLLNIVYCYYFDLLLDINSFFFVFIFTLFFGTIILFKKKNLKKTSIFEKIITVIVGYIVMPIILAIPYFLVLNNISIFDAYFESVSGFTSTGFTIFENLKQLDQSLILWRSSTQWIGGLYFLISLILLIDIFDLNLKKSLTNFISFNTSETLKQSLKISIIYLFLTTLIFVILNISGVRIFDSFNLSLTIISSGGFLPDNSLDLIITSKIQEIILSFTMLVSFFSLFLIYNLFFFKRINIDFFSEDLYLFFYLLFLIIFFFIFFNSNGDFPSLFLAICSSISNIGFSFDIPKNLNFIFLILIIIGGSFFSTSSGLRFYKIFLLLKFSLNELASHAKPKNVYINKLSFFNISFQASDFQKYFLSVIIFIMSLSLLSLFLTISGIESETSFKLSILTLMNTVNSSLSDLQNFNFYDLNNFSKCSLILFMIIGRVELLSILIISKKFFFKS
ncbi:potassium transporter TrkG [Candidatus Pelagibacter communis]|uniref:potassium transporter TrkG n=1 Tax=Pelagibacter ubique TaxID=198252 RepID=UPI00094CABED